MDLQPCAGCRRHIAVVETVCPFCARVVTAAPYLRIQLRGRVSRAAVFGAALAACGCPHEDAPAKQPPPRELAPEPLDRDFNELLGPATPAGGAPRPKPVDAALPDAAIADAAVDAAAPDAGIDPQEAERRRLSRLEGQRIQRERERIERELEEKQRQVEQQRQIDEMRRRNPCCKPYGAPPARRRLV